VQHRVQNVRQLTDTAYVLRIDRNNIEFEPGQYVSLGLVGDINMREYSIYSGVSDEYLEVLVREVQEGYVSKLLKRLEAGDALELEGPFGFFTIDSEAREAGKFLFVATGTGISPFHCFERSYPGLDYRLVHGVRTCAERFDMDMFPRDRYVSCVSREEGGDYRGRVTEYLRENPVDPDTYCYLCGNCDMIYEAFDILTQQGVSPERLFAEVYF